MNVYLTMLGCRLNEAEVQSWRRGFLDAGHGVVADAERADVIVLNTCAVTTEATHKSRQLARRLHRRNPGAPIVATGCHAELSPNEAARLAGVDLIVGNRDKDRLVELVAERLDVAAMPEIAVEADGGHVFAEHRTRAFVKVQDGCRNRCTFCIVTMARGDERSRTIDDVVTEVHRLETEGFREVVLTGVHLGGYGSDLGTPLTELVTAVMQRTTVPRVRLSSLEPWDLPDDFFDAWGDPRLCPHLHLPLQSGSDSVLRRMARRCPTERYCDLVERARSAIPGLTLTTDLIVGFPGESDADFADTLAFVEATSFAHVHVFAYSPRPGTAAATLGDQVSREAKRERSRAARELADRMKATHLAAAVGTTRDVLWEGSPETRDDGSLRFFGYTDNYLRAETVVVAGVDLRNRITAAQAIATADDARLVMEIVESPVTVLGNRHSRDRRVIER